MRNASSGQAGNKIWTNILFHTTANKTNKSWDKSHTCQKISRLQSIMQEHFGQHNIPIEQFDCEDCEANLKKRNHMRRHTSKRQLIVWNVENKSNLSIVYSSINPKATF